PDTTDTDESDGIAPGDVGPDTTPDGPKPKTIKVDCEIDENCVIECGSNGFCNDEGVCQFESVDGCLIIDDAEEYMTCFESAETHPDSTCLFCNPIFATSAWSGTVIRESFEKGIGWFYTIVDFINPPTASWTSSTERAASGEGSMYFGNPYNLNYQTAYQVKAEVISVPVEIPDGVDLNLSFQLWMETEELPGYDLLTASIVLQSGQHIEVWNSDAIGGTTYGMFFPINVSLPGVAAQEVAIAFHFDSFDKLDNDYEGVYIDEVALTTGCCNTEDDDAGQSDCDDGNPCTIDTCPAFGGGCEYKLIPECCSTSLDCDDGDQCTVDVCPEPGSECVWDQVAECCHQTSDCNDGNPCTEDSCDEAANLCLHQPLCCEADSDCDDGDKCTESTCSDGQCAHEFVCCLSALECNDGEYCTTDECIEGDCVNTPAQLPGCCSPDVYVQSFDFGDPDGWDFDPTVGGVGWQVAEVSKYQSGPGVLYYGNPGSENFDNGTINEGKVTSAEIQLPDAVEISLSFDVYFDGESSPTYDKFWVEIVGPGSTVQIASKSDISVKNWATVTKDLSYLAGQSVQLVFNFATIDGLVNQAFGLAVDDLTITTSCEVKACSQNSNCNSADICLSGVCEQGGCTYVNGCCESDEECSDGNVCTEDICSTALCTFKPIPECCEVLSDCDDGNPCTLDFCSGFGGSCSHEAIGGCCLSNLDCDDADICTQDLCIDNICQSPWICCETDGDCDDGDDVCTEDTCVDSFCAFANTAAPGCCDESPVNWDFETPLNFTYTNTQAPCGWQVISSNQAISGSQVLYYGNPSAMNYDCGLNAGTATSEQISLLPGVDYNLTFQLLVDTESGTTYDKLLLYLLVDGKEILLWDKSSLQGTGSWKEYQFNFSAMAGKSFQLRWNFDTFDGIINDKLGVMLDDVKITSSCQVVSCTADSECDDGVNGTTGSCSAAGCEWSL
ncbi:MAG: hypothetical protein VYE15_07690, partial [Myxococcota bacterium]|nr:hypothetical protein [Myxococcota bacterium]